MPGLGGPYCTEMYSDESQKKISKCPFIGAGLFIFAGIIKLLSWQLIEFSLFAFYTDYRRRKGRICFFGMFVKIGGGEKLFYN